MVKRKLDQYKGRMSPEQEALGGASEPIADE